MGNPTLAQKIFASKVVALNTITVSTHHSEQKIMVKLKATTPLRWGFLKTVKNHEQVHNDRGNKRPNIRGIYVSHVSIME
ncbi:MAG: hypothetical protein ABFC57_13915 [Veillonellales bacterium]